MSFIVFQAALKLSHLFFFVKIKMSVKRKQ